MGVVYTHTYILRSWRLIGSMVREPHLWLSVGRAGKTRQLRPDENVKSSAKKKGGRGKMKRKHCGLLTRFDLWLNFTHSNCEVKIDFLTQLL